MAYNLNGFKTINGTTADETLTGTHRNEAIYGNGGADTLTGGTGQDLLVGGASNVTFVYSADATWSSGFLAVNAGDAGGAGTGETFSLQGYGRSYDVFVGSGTNNTLVMGDGKKALFLDDGLSPGVDATRLYNIQTIQMGAGGQLVDLSSTRVSYGDVTIRGGSGSDIMMSNAGNDTLTGGAGNDYIWAGSGNDTLDGGTGNDTLLGGKGNDVYTVDGAGDTVTELAGEGIDTVRSSIVYTLGTNVENLTLTGTSAINGSGNALDNVMVGNAGANVFDAASGNDQVNAGGGSDIVYGGIGNDKLYGEDGDDTIYGGDGVDHVNGGAGNDALYGGAGNDGFFAGGLNDVVYGDDGNDQIYGDGGNDAIYGGKGNDLLAGGQFKNGFSLGNDTFGWTKSDVVNTDGSSAGVDRLIDFGAGDRLDFSQVVRGAGVADASDMVRLTETSTGTLISASADGGASFVDVVLVDNQFDLDLDTLIANGTVIV